MIDVSLATESTGEDGQSDSLSRAVIEAVADAEDTDPIELPPLYDAIDPDALDSVFFGTKGDAVDGRITFTYHGYEVQVDSDQAVALEAVDDRRQIGGRQTSGRRRN